MQDVWKGLRFGFYIIFHPFNGFWEMRREHKGNRISATILLAAMVLTVVVEKQYTGYFFSSYSATEFNVLLEIGQVLMYFFLWCIANWCLTTLMDGEGRFIDIYMATAYALIPYIVIHMTLVPISHFMCLEEQSYYQFFSSLATIWTGGLIFFGSMTVHQYSLKKNILVATMTILGMGILIFIGMLFYDLVDQILAFAISVYREISLRVT